ncbi:MAG TPA: hypothetical protein VHT75_04365 [Acidimicrobiales bacterium]|jgi:hypothetical protein|nr:hypothetical protein [Acidimicrobiales bacterium]
MIEPLVDLDDVEIPAGPEEPSVTFRLDGREWACRERDQLPALVVEQLMGVGTLMVEEFFNNLLVPADVAPFRALLHRQDCPLTLPRVRKLMEMLAEQVLRRPTVRSSSSPRGPRKTAGTSKAGSSSPGTPRKRRAG